MNAKSSPDIWVTMRTALLGAIVAWLAATRYGLEHPEVVTALGVILGAVYDLIAFKLKTWFGGSANLGGGKFGVLFVLVTLGCRSQAQTPQFGYFYDPGARVIAPAVTYAVGKPLQIRGRLPATVTPVTLAGFQKSSLTGGAGGLIEVPLQDWATLAILPQLRLDRGRVVSATVWLGISLRM